MSANTLPVINASGATVTLNGDLDANGNFTPWHIISPSQNTIPVFDASANVVLNTLATQITANTISNTLLTVNGTVASLVTNLGTAPMQSSGGTIGIVAGNAIIGRVSQVDSGGGDATDTINHAVRVNLVAANTSTPLNVSQSNASNLQTLSFVNSYDPVANTWTPIRSDGSLLFSNTISTTGPSAWISTTSYQSIVAQINGLESGFLYIEGSNDANNVGGVLYVFPLDDFSLDDHIEKSGIFLFKPSTLYFRYNVQNITGSANITFVGRTVAGPAGADMLSVALSGDQNVPINVSIKSGIKADNAGGIMLSDAIGPFVLSSTPSANIIFDSSNYSTFNVTTDGTCAGGFFASNDQKTWTALYGVSTSTSAPTPNIIPSANFIFPCGGRYIKYQGSVAGIATLYFRAAPMPSPIGIVNVQGNSGPGGTAGNPVMVGGSDPSALVRRLLTDTSGRLSVAATSFDNNIRPLGSTSTSYENQAALSVQDTSQFESQTSIEILGQILLELRILNQQMYEMPRILQSGAIAIDEPQVLRGDPTLFIPFTQ